MARPISFLRRLSNATASLGAAASRATGGDWHLREEELRKLRARWSSMQRSQRFVKPTRVFEAHAGEMGLPEKSPGSVRFVCVSDTHGQHEELTDALPAGDVLLHAGDFTSSGSLDEVRDFGLWLAAQPFPRKAVVAGNHDLAFDPEFQGHELPEIVDAARALLTRYDSTVTYLEDSSFTVQGVRVYGSPWQPKFGDWAFNLPRGQQLAEKWDAVPEQTDILLVHAPPLGRGDQCFPGEDHTGCADLLDAVQSRIRPQFCVFGHIHESRGVTCDGVTHFVNASSLDSDHQLKHKPLVFDVPARSE